MLLILLLAVPGPDTTAIVANSSDPESIALAETYREARAIPSRQLCRLSLPSGPDISLEQFRSLFLEPFEACLNDGGVLDRIEAVALMRGVPLRVGIGDERLSLAAALGVWRTTTSTGAALIGAPPGNRVNCGGGTCYAARVRNAFTRGTFEPGWSTTLNGLVHRPLLVTMIHGRTALDAAKLIASATTAEALGGARGTFVLMRGADPARGVLDLSYSWIAPGLIDRGFSDVVELPFDPARTGLRIAAFFTGTAQIGATIEGNEYLPGALVDNVTSFGALPENFGAAAEEVQVSIARWVAKGVAGVHGTTDEPLNNCFPGRELIWSWVEGGTLAESFHRALPYVYWRNLVLGDPMAAAYAVRPRVFFEPTPSQVYGSASLFVRATTATGAVDRLVLYADGVEIARVAGDRIEGCFPLPLGDQVELLAVAQHDGAHRSKGWSRVVVNVSAGPLDCTTPDAGVESPDVGFDAGFAADAAEVVVVEPSGCDCSTGTRGSLWSLLLVMALVLRRGNRGI